MIEFQCNNCGRKFNAPESSAGKKGKCPNCGNVIVFPRQDDNVSLADEIETRVNSGTSGIDSSLFDIPQRIATTNGPITQQHSPDESSEDLQQSEESTDTEQTSPKAAATCRLPWIIDIFLYPFSLEGVIHLIGLWLLIFLLCPFIMAVVGLGTEYVPIVYFLPVAYMLYYFTECIRGSASGHFRAPDFWMHPTDTSRWDCVSQLLVVVGSIAVCFWPVAVYYIATERSDLICWLLMVCGGFFFPMVLLAVVLFDSFNALNPLLIIPSILSTFIPYCGLIIILFVSSYVCLRMNSRFYNFRPIPIVPFFLRAVQLYMINVAVGFLGRFYHRHEDKLDWEV